MDILISKISANELDVILQDAYNEDIVNIILRMLLSMIVPALLQHQVLKVLQLLLVKELCLNYYLILLDQNY